ncbi:MAG: hypothetical protein HY931_02560 [Candidatus Falkowbacteria bacterium]|nr:MAG: hypothetical protein HY931_02560 [Candidatus Falkowbacteria bacterium]
MKSSELSRISKKMLKLKKAFKGLVRAILDHPTVEKVFGTALITYWIIGFLGFAWIVIAGGAFFVSGFKADEGSMVDWLRDFSVACPVLALVWLFITITTVWMFVYKEKHHNQTNSAEPKAQ